MNTFLVTADCSVESTEWAQEPNGQQVEAELSVAIHEATWPSLESQIRIEILSKTWPQLLRFATADLSEAEPPCPEELFDSILELAKDEYSGRLWIAISGTFRAKLDKLKPGTLKQGSRFSTKKKIRCVHEFKLPVGPLIIKATKTNPSAMIPQTEVTVVGTHDDDLKIEITL